jgi:hypothetical protein
MSINAPAPASSPSNPVGLGIAAKERTDAGWHVLSSRIANRASFLIRNERRLRHSKIPRLHDGSA